MRDLPKIILVFAAVDWPIYMRRPMVHALAEAAKPYGSTVVAVNRPLCFATTWFRKPNRIPELFGRPRLEKLANNLYLYSPRYFIHDQFANAVGPLEEINLFALRKSYRHLQKRLGITEPAPMIWFNYPQLGYVARLFDDSFCVFEIYDNLTDPDGNESNTVNRLEKKLRSRIDLLLTTSKKIHEKYAGPYRRSFMFGNGLSRTTYQRLSDPNVEALPEILDIPSPRLGYAGMISDRLDWRLVADLASAEPSWNFIFAGHMADDNIRNRMAAHPNVRFPGEYPQQDVPSISKSFDLGIMPYRDTPFFDFLNPLKFYELAAAGLPMVASPVEELRQFPDDLVRVVASNGVDVWREAIGNMLAADPAISAKIGPQTAAEFIWEDMTAALLKKITEEGG